MGNININKKENVLKLKENINKILESKLSDITLKENLDKIGNMEFNKIKMLFEHFFTKLYETKEGRNTIKGYCNEIRNNKTLKKLYSLTESIKNSKDVEFAEEYISEILREFNSLNKAVVSEANKRLGTIIREGLARISVTNEDFEKFYNDYSSSNLNESIDYVMSNKKTLSNINEYSKAKNVIKEYVSSNKSNDGVCENVTAEDLNSLISENFTKSENKVIQDVALYELKGLQKKDLFEDYKKQCIVLIDESLSDGNVEEKSNLELLREKLSAKECKDETMNYDLLKLSELIETLSC